MNYAAYEERLGAGILSVEACKQHSQQPDDQTPQAGLRLLYKSRAPQSLRFRLFRFALRLLGLPEIGFVVGNHPQMSVINPTRSHLLGALAGEFFLGLAEFPSGESALMAPVIQDERGAKP